MTKVEVSGLEYEVRFNANRNTGELNGTAFDWDVARNGDSIHVIKEGVSFNALMIDFNKEEKYIVVKVNNTEYVLRLSNRFDELLKEMGLDGLSSLKEKDVKAPMPGLVLSVVVKEGAEIKKGDPLVVLEAMKMENILKSPTDGKIKSIKVSKDAIVEKNEVLLDFE